MLEQERPASRVLGGFEVLDLIGQGGMGSVYLARQISMDRLVALKILPPNLAKDTTFLERFYREARSSAMLNSPNIVRGIDVGEAEGYHYFAMEYVEGPVLGDILKERGRLSERDALRVVLQVGTALEHAHDRGLIHRDVKPGNIIFSTRDKAVKLADLGLAKGYVDRGGEHTKTGDLVGTPYYMAPELVRGEANADIRCDIYSLGATLYHMVTGRPPFEGQSPAEILVKHLNEPLTPPDQVNLLLSTGTCEIIEKMMSKDPRDRYQKPHDVVMDVRRLLAGRPPLLASSGREADLLERVEAEPSQVFMPKGPPEPHPQPSSDFPFLWVFLAAFGLIILLVILVVATRGG
jgi:serine/threonine-protein kinase